MPARMNDDSSRPDIVLVESRLDPVELRPAQGNRSMVIEDETLRERVREITFALIGRGEPLE